MTQISHWRGVKRIGPDYIEARCLTRHEEHQVTKREEEADRRAAPRASCLRALCVLSVSLTRAFQRSRQVSGSPSWAPATSSRTRLYAYRSQSSSRLA